MIKTVKVRSEARELMREYVGDLYADIREAKKEESLLLIQHQILLKSFLRFLI